MVKRAVLLFSGGLDSILSYHLLKSQGIDTLVVRFITPFLNPKIRNFPKDCRFEEIPLQDDYLEIITNAGFNYRILDEDLEISKSQYKGINLESLKVELYK